MFERFTEKSIQVILLAQEESRPPRRAVSRLVEDNLAEAILSGQIRSGDTALMDIDDDGQVQVQPKQSPVLVA